MREIFVSLLLFFLFCYAVNLLEAILSFRVLILSFVRQVWADYFSYQGKIILSTLLKLLSYEFFQAGWWKQAVVPVLYEDQSLYPLILLMVLSQAY